MIPRTGPPFILNINYSNQRRPPTARLWLLGASKAIQDGNGMNDSSQMANRKNIVCGFWRKSNYSIALRWLLGAAFFLQEENGKRALFPAITSKKNDRTGGEQ